MRKLEDSQHMMVMSAMSDWYRSIREKTHHDDINRIVRESGYAKRMEWQDDGRAAWMWCGMFCACHARAVGMSRQLLPGLYHVDNVEDFFNYRYGKRVPRWVLVDGNMVELQTFHEEHDASRMWITNANIREMISEDGAHMVGFADVGLVCGGDILLVDSDGNGVPNHITMVRNYSGGVITTVEGNAGGVVFVKKTGGGGEATEDVIRDAVALNHRNLTKSSHVKRIYGIGRFSQLDFIHQDYKRG